MRLFETIHAGGSTKNSCFLFTSAAKFFNDTDLKIIAQNTQVFCCLQELLPSVDSLLYLDGDVLFLSAPEDVWQMLHVMNTSQLAALSPEHQDYSVGWYNRFAKHPYYGNLGTDGRCTRGHNFNMIILFCVF